jgi:two-component system sensor histidine kinase/response regulator
MLPSKILIIDDFKTNIRYLTRLLKSQGHEIYAGDNADDAVQMISSDEFDLILLDIVMPGIDGYKLCEFVRKSFLNATTPVIFLTSRNDEKSIVKGFELGGQDYIIRPFNDSELLARVNTHIELKRNRVELRTLNEQLEKTVSKRTAELQTALAQLRQSYKELKIAQKETLQLEKVKENFLKIINHEIRTPLNGIIGFQELIRYNLRDEKLISYLEMMQESVTRLEKFSMDALFLTELKAGMYKLEVRCIGVSDMVEQVLVQFESRIKADNITVHQEIQEAVIYTDAQLFHYAIKNLLENAIYHTPRNHSIMIKGEQKGKFYQIEVIDKGKGFPANITESKYKMFINEEFTDNRPGLSLYTISLISKYLKGKLQLSNCPGGGASALLSVKTLQPDT